MDLIGKMLGHFEVVAKLGAGGMATVYRANQPSLGRQVAIKVLSDELARDETFRERFLREARAVAQLTHPNILPVYDFGKDEETGALYYVMQLVDGGTLSQRLEQPMSVEEAVRIIVQIARALDYAHRHGVIHRDVKPANVLLTPDGRPLLSDFGIAHIMQETHLTQTGTSLGTPAYMSPEQARGELADHRSDQYALGIMAYELLTGSVPFQADTPVGLLHQHAFVPPEPLRKLRPGLPKNLEKVVMRALAKYPVQRYASAGEFADELEAAVSGKRLLPWLKKRTPLETPSRGLSTARLPTTPPAQPAVLPEAPTSFAGRAGRALLGFGKGLLRTALIVLAVLIVVVATALVLASVVVGKLVEQTMVRQDWQLDTVDTGVTYYYTQLNFESGLQAAVEPYTLDALTDLRVELAPPDAVTFYGDFRGRDIALQFRIGEKDGIPDIQVERFNNAPLYIIGGILSGRVNSGLQQVWGDAPVRIESMTMTPERITVRYEQH